MTKDALNKILEAHRKWLDGEIDGERADLRDADLRDADLRDANLRCADLRDADLSCANLSCANLRDADLSCADLRCANLKDADLSCANLRDADLRCADLRDADLRCANLKDADLRCADLRDAELSCAQGLLDAINYMEEHFERTDDGYIAYKTFGAVYTAPKGWEIKPGSVINENVNMCRADECGCGINVAPLEWVRKNYKGKIWKVLIRWEWLVGVCVPYNTDGKIRCERVELVEIVKEEQGNGTKAM